MKIGACLLVVCLLFSGCDISILNPTISNSNSSENSNELNVHDLVNFSPATNPFAPTPAPGGGTEVPSAVPANGQSIAQAVAEGNPSLLRNACPANGEAGWAFMDLIVKTLQSNDPRWGYLVKSSTGLISQDVIAYRATSDTTGVWGVDIILDVCGLNNFTWQVIGFDANAKWASTRK